MSLSVNLHNVTLAYPGERTPAVRDVSLQVPAGELLVLAGRSGSGKSTLLRLVAGLEVPDSGRIELGDECVAAGGGRFIPPHRRRVGLVSQSGDLFPHLTVARNIEYGLRTWDRVARGHRVDEMLEHVGLSGFGRRYPSELSGGEAQRVALARALAPRPGVLLLDEPFSNLDAALRERLRILTADLLRRERTTSIFVTHHGDDALSVGDRIAVLELGRVAQIGSPREIWERPSTIGVAALFGAINVLPAPQPAPRQRTSTPAQEDRQPPSFWLRPDALELCPEAADCLASGSVESIEYLGSTQRVCVRVSRGEGDALILVTVPGSQKIQPGERVGIRRIDA